MKCATIGWLMLSLAAATQRVHAHGSHSLLLAHVDAALLDQPENGALWYSRAQLDFEHQDWEESLRDLEKAEHFSPGKFPILWLKGRVLEAVGKPADALSALESFILNNPKNSAALASRARVSAVLGQTEKSIADFKAALAYDSKASIDLVQEVAQALTYAGQTDEAIHIVEDARLRLGEVPSLQLKWAELQVSAGHFDSALAGIEGFQKSAPRPEPWMAKRASVLAQAGRIAESRTAWRLLASKIKNLPAQERDSHAMTILTEQAYQALSALSSTSNP